MELRLLCRIMNGRSGFGTCRRITRTCRRDLCRAPSLVPYSVPLRFFWQLRFPLWPRTKIPKQARPQPRYASRSRLPCGPKSPAKTTAAQSYSPAPPALPRIWLKSIGIWAESKSPANGSRSTTRTKELQTTDNLLNIASSATKLRTTRNFFEAWPGGVSRMATKISRVCITRSFSLATIWMLKLRKRRSSGSTCATSAALG